MQQAVNVLMRCCEKPIFQDLHWKEILRLWITMALFLLYVPDQMQKLIEFHMMRVI